MANNLLTPIVNNRTRSVNFFNGRLLTGEDLTAEQQANRVAHSLLGQAAGAGVAYGLEVSESATLSQVASPVLSITRGLAINSNGGTLLLDSDADISLVRPASPAAAGSSVFAECLPMQSGVYIAGAGVYLLTIGPASAAQGLAEVSGVSTGAAPCNSKYKADGVQFRLVQLDLTQTELGDVNHLRNVVAYKCFGVADWASDVTDPFGKHSGGHGLIDQLRAANTITGCEVPLAVLYWTATDGVVFVDMWSARRALVSRDLLDFWAPEAGRRRFVEGLAMFLQFQKQIDDMVEFGVSGVPLTSIVFTDYFKYLPATGIVTMTGVNNGATNALTSFFKGLTIRGPEFIEGARFQTLVRTSFAYSPIDLATGELIWVYTVRENIQAFDNNQIKLPQTYIVFSSGYMPYFADARFDSQRWDYSNYALR